MNGALRSSEFYVAIVAAILQVLEKFEVIPSSVTPLIISLVTYAMSRLLSKFVKRVIPVKEVL